MNEPKVGLDRSKTGRRKGTRNKTTRLLKEAVLKAAELAGDKDGLVGYLKQQAKDNPGPFLTLLGKVLPLQVNGTSTVTIKRIERVVIDHAEDQDSENAVTTH